MPKKKKTKTNVAAGKRFINREASWLEFNRRVLALAQDPAVPLLERLKFLAITGSNLDEFCMVRLGSLRMMERELRTATDIAGMSVAEQLALVRDGIAQLTDDQYRCLRGLEAELAGHGLRRLDAGAEMAQSAAAQLRRLVGEEFLPVLTPFWLDLDQPATDAAPLLDNLGLYVLVRFAESAPGRPRFAAIPLLGVPRVIRIPAGDGGARQVMLAEDAVLRHLDAWFPETPVAEAGVFRITRNADLVVREDEAADLLSGMEEVLLSRQTSFLVRLELAPSLSAESAELLAQWLGVEPDDQYRPAGPLDLGAFRKVAGQPGFEALRDTPWEPQAYPRIPPKGSMFDVIAAGDLLLIHPYESFDPVVRLLREAAEDPNVLAIKQILYRASPDSQIIQALLRAADKGKPVTALIELKARFDEERNIDWARRLELAGVQVVYGVKGYKTHAKACLIVRREERGIVRYLHFGTGNYNEATARLYSDLSLFTADPALGQDATAFFNTVCGLSSPVAMAKLAMAPLHLRGKLMTILDQAIEQAEAGTAVTLLAKMNSLCDETLIRKLYAASAAGVSIQLNVRGICCLRPGVKGLSEKIRVISIVDRYLEHARVICLQVGAETRAWFGSADWMPRNLDRRIELLVPVEDAECRARLVAFLESCFHDNTHVWELGPDGRWQRRQPTGKKTPHRAQEELYLRAKQAATASKRRPPVLFEPHLPGKK